MYVTMSVLILIFSSLCLGGKAEWLVLVSCARGWRVACQVGVSTQNRGGLAVFSSVARCNWFFDVLTWFAQ